MLQEDADGQKPAKNFGGGGGMHGDFPGDGEVPAPGDGKGEKNDMSRGSSDVKLQYIDDDPDSYANIFDNAKTDRDDSDDKGTDRTLRREGSDKILHLRRI